MKVLSIGSDTKLFEGGNVLLRVREYASKVLEYHVIVFSLKQQNFNFQKIDNLYLYPTNSRSKLNYVFDAIRIGIRLIRKEGFSRSSAVITCQDPFESGVVGMFLKRKFHLPLQLQIHTDFLSPYFSNNILNRIRLIFAKFTIPSADGIRTVSSIISDSIVNSFPNIKAKVDILPIFVDTEKLINIKRGEKSELFTEFTIYMYSRLTKEKRIDIALNTFRKVIDSGKVPKNIKLIIAGSGSEKDNLIKLSKDLGLGNNVDFLGWLGDPTSFFHLGVDVFLLTSEYEGYGMTLIEAGASGCPIVTTRVGIAQTSLFKDGFNSYICPVGGVDCLSNRLIDLITDEEKRKLFKDRMQDSIRSISISKEEYVLKYVSLLKKLL